MNLYFATSSADKFKELQSCLSIPVIHKKVDITEIQGTKEEIAIHKLRTICTDHPNAYIIVDDTSIEIKALNGFPGPYGKDFIKIGLDCIENLVSKIGRHATFSCVLGIGIYRNNKFEYKLIHGAADGNFVPRISEECGFDNTILLDECNKRFSDLTLEERCLYTHRGIAGRKLNEYINTTLIKEFQYYLKLIPKIMVYLNINCYFCLKGL